eukprot:scaffold266255_cov50-Prasinocladus_malaysianus.AAC.2
MAHYFLLSKAPKVTLTNGTTETTFISSTSSESVSDDESKQWLRASFMKSLMSLLRPEASFGESCSAAREGGDTAGDGSSEMLIGE